MSNVPDQKLKTLLEAAKNGDESAFGALYAEFYTPVFRYLYVRLGNREDAEDFAQTVFLKVYKALPRYRDYNISPLAYFFTIAKHLLIDHWKKKKEVTLDAQDLEAISPAVPVSEMQKPIESQEQQARIENALTSLSNDQREAIALKYVSDLSNTEIAHILGKSEEAVRQLHCRALKTLRRTMKPDPEKE